MFFIFLGHSRVWLFSLLGDSLANLPFGDLDTDMIFQDAVMFPPEAETPQVAESDLSSLDSVEVHDVSADPASDPSLAATMTQQMAQQAALQQAADPVRKVLSRFLNKSQNENGTDDAAATSAVLRRSELMAASHESSRNGIGAFALQQDVLYVSCGFRGDE